MTYVDFQAVKAEAKIERVAEMLGFDLKEKNGQLRGECIICEQGGPRAFCITLSKQAYFCFGCSTGGDVIQLVAQKEGVHQKEAAHKIVEMLSLKDHISGEKTNKVQHLERGFKQLDYLKPDHEAVEALGIEPDDAERIGLGYAPRGAGRGSVMIPVRLEDGTLVGYVGVQELTFVPREWHF